MLQSLYLLAAVTCGDFVDQEFRVPPAFQAIVADAKRRWAEKTQVKTPMDEWFPIVFTMHDERCVYLRLRSGYMGSEPVYCYNRDTDEFTRADDQME